MLFEELSREVGHWSGGYFPVARGITQSHDSHKIMGEMSFEQNKLELEFVQENRQCRDIHWSIYQIYLYCINLLIGQPAFSKSQWSEKGRLGVSQLPHQLPWTSHCGGTQAWTSHCGRTREKLKECLLVDSQKSHVITQF